MEPADRIEPSPIAYHATARPLSYTGKLTNWIPAADLNRALLITKQVRRHLRLQGMEPIPGLEPGFLNYNRARRRLRLIGETDRRN